MEEENKNSDDNHSDNDYDDCVIDGLEKTFHSDKERSPAEGQDEPGLADPELDRPKSDKPGDMNFFVRTSAASLTDMEGSSRDVPEGSFRQSFLQQKAESVSKANVVEGSADIQSSVKKLVIGRGLSRSLFTVADPKAPLFELDLEKPAQVNPAPRRRFGGERAATFLSKDGQTGDSLLGLGNPEPDEPVREKLSDTEKKPDESPFCFRCKLLGHWTSSCRKQRLPSPHSARRGKQNKDFWNEESRQKRRMKEDRELLDEQLSVRRQNEDLAIKQSRLIEDRKSGDEADRIRIQEDRIVEDAKVRLLRQEEDLLTRRDRLAEDRDFSDSFYERRDTFMK